MFSMQGFQFGALLERLREREERRFGTSGGVLVEVDEARRCLGGICQQWHQWSGFGAAFRVREGAPDEGAWRHWHRRSGPRAG